MTESGRAETTPAPRKRHGWIALLGFLLILAGPIVYTALLIYPWIQRSAAPAWVLMGLGILVGLWAARDDRRLIIRLSAINNAVITLLFGIGFFVLARLPATTKLDSMTSAIDFALPDQSGRLVTLHDARANGPVLLVFYRGFW